jgi:hypothetical protein
MSGIQAQLMKIKFTGSPQSRLQALYCPDTFLSVQADTEGLTPVWVGDNNILLLGFNINGGCTLAVPGELVMELITGGPSDLLLATYSVLVDAGGTNFEFNSNYPDGYGLLTPDIPTTININLSSDLASGHVNVNIFGVVEVFPDP